MNIPLLISVIVAFALPSIVTYVVWKYRRDKHVIIEELKKRCNVRGLELVRRRRVSRANIYRVLSDLERRGYVQRLGGKPPYLYRWRGRDHD